MTYTIGSVGQPLHWLGGQLDVRCEIDTGGGVGFGDLWDVGRWDIGSWGSTDPIWQDFTEHVMSVDINRGSERWGERYVAGSCAIMLDNQSGIFSPDAVGVASSPFFRPFRPGRRMRVVVIPDPEVPVKVPLFTGRLVGSPSTFGEGAWDIVAILNAVDFMADWQAANPVYGSTTGAQLTSERVTTALDLIDWPAADRDIQTGEHTMADSDLPAPALELCAQAADAEGGGLLLFDGR